MCKNIGWESNGQCKVAATYKNCARLNETFLKNMSKVTSAKYNENRTMGISEEKEGTRSDLK